MNKEQNTTHKVIKDLEPGLMLPNLQELSHGDLLDLFIIVARKYVQGMQNGLEFDQLNAVQVQIETLKNEIHRNKHLSFRINHS